VLIGFLYFMANLVIALIILHLLAVKAVEMNPDSPATKALAFLA
jgi:hypothetical protein